MGHSTTAESPTEAAARLIADLPDEGDSNKLDPIHRKVAELTAQIPKTGSRQALTGLQGDLESQSLRLENTELTGSGQDAKDAVGIEIKQAINDVTQRLQHATDGASGSANGRPGTISGQGPTADALLQRSPFTAPEVALICAVLAFALSGVTLLVQILMRSDLQWLRRQVDLQRKQQVAAQPQASLNLAPPAPAQTAIAAQPTYTVSAGWHVTPPLHHKLNTAPGKKQPPDMNGLPPAVYTGESHGPMDEPTAEPAPLVPEILETVEPQVDRPLQQAPPGGVIMRFDSAAKLLRRSEQSASGEGFLFNVYRDSAAQEWRAEPIVEKTVLRRQLFGYEAVFKLEGAAKGTVTVRAYPKLEEVGDGYRVRDRGTLLVG